jgi:hypothetical protein
MKTPETKFLPMPRTMGVFVLLLSILAFIAGHLRRELVLSLLGAVFITVEIYCFLAVFFLGILHRRKINSLLVRLAPKSITAGGNIELFPAGREDGLSGGKPPGFFRLPAVLIR